MRYVTLRIRDDYDSNRRPVAKLLGQRDTDLNWQTIRTFDTIAEARDYAIGMAMRERIETVYDLHGYGLKHLDESWDEYLTRLQEEADAKNE